MLPQQSKCRARVSAHCSSRAICSSNRHQARTWLRILPQAKASAAAFGLTEIKTALAEGDDRSARNCHFRANIFPAMNQAAAQFTCLFRLCKKAFFPPTIGTSFIPRSLRLTITGDRRPLLAWLGLCMSMASRSGEIVAKIMARPSESRADVNQVWNLLPAPFVLRCSSDLSFCFCNKFKRFFFLMAMSIYIN